MDASGRESRQGAGTSRFRSTFARIEFLRTTRALQEAGMCNRVNEIGFRSRLVALIFAAFAALAHLAAAGQAGGTAAAIIGQVTDESGAVLPGVTVTAA